MTCFKKDLKRTTVESEVMRHFNKKHKKDSERAVQAASPIPGG